MNRNKITWAVISLAFTLPQLTLAEVNSTSKTRSKRKLPISSTTICPQLASPEDCAYIKKLEADAIKLSIELAHCKASLYDNKTTDDPRQNGKPIKDPKNPDCCGGDDNSPNQIKNGSLPGT